MPLSKILDLPLMQRSIVGLVTELWFPRFLTKYWNVFFYHLPCRLLKCVEIVATVGWKWGCRQFSWPCSLRNSKHRGSWEPQCVPPALHYCIMPIPSLQLQKKPVLCREAESLVAELWSPGLVKEYSDLRWFYVTTAKQCFLKFELLTFNHGGWKWGCQHFSCPCSAKCDYCRCQEEICCICLFRLRIWTFTPYHQLDVPESWFLTVYHHLWIMETALQQKSCSLHYCHLSHIASSQPQVGFDR